MFLMTYCMSRSHSRSVWSLVFGCLRSDFRHFSPPEFPAGSRFLFSECFPELYDQLLRRSRTRREVRSRSMARNLNSDPFHLAEWIADYLAERGYAATLQAFRSDLRNDRTLTVESFVDYINHCINTLNFQGLIDIWQEMDKRLFSRLQPEYSKSANVLENRLLKLFLVTAVQKNNIKKAQECLECMANSPRLSADPELAEWFRIPYVKSPENDPLTAKYCSKFWQDTLSVSLYNFTSAVFNTSFSNLQNQKIKAASIPETALNPLLRAEPRKLENSFGQHSSRQLPVTALRQKFHKALVEMAQSHRSMPDVEPEVTAQPAPVACLPENTRPTLSTAPVPSPQTSPRIPTNLRRPPRQHSSMSESSALPAPNSVRPGSSHSLSSPRDTRRSADRDVREMDPNVWINPKLLPSDPKDHLIHLVCEESLGSHETQVVECRFSPCGNKVASFDTGGCLKIWKGAPPVVKLVSTCTFPSRFTCLAWIPKKDTDMMVVGDENGTVKLLEDASSTCIMEVNLGREITTLAVTSDLGSPYVVCGTGGSADSHNGIFVIDLATFTIRSEVRHVSQLTASYFHPTKSLLLFGFDTGEVCEYNAKFQKFSEKLSIHSSTVSQLEYLWNEAYCVSVGKDNKLIISHLATGGVKVAEVHLELSFSPTWPNHRVFATSKEGSLVLVRSDKGAKVIKLKGDLSSCLHFGTKEVAVTSLDWITTSDKSTGLLGYADGKICWFRLLHLE